ncbi:hypothetical protein GOQ27_13325 [Clostridium sp. D2Q-11]|uniref:Uncharacterized protein n=1 Tax=Anaeromonas frigoriresistens TaxID=2683708 RepID=A0A942Z7D6_9FIRM|nr:hypothetical protein [Anaeromonas frigoriresistens]MBS4539451.1 hypothetical protein [Anaeromonas frigoriresistens]
MKKQAKTILKVERFFTDTSNCRVEDMFTAYFRATIDTVLDEELSVEMQEQPSDKEVA